MAQGSVNGIIVNGDVPKSLSKIKNQTKYYVPSYLKE